MYSCIHTVYYMFTFKYKHANMQQSRFLIIYHHLRMNSFHVFNYYPHFYSYMNLNHVTECLVMFFKGFVGWSDRASSLQQNQWLENGLWSRRDQSEGGRAGKGTVYLAFLHVCVHSIFVFVNFFIYMHMSTGSTDWHMGTSEWLKYDRASQE